MGRTLILGDEGGWCADTEAASNPSGGDLEDSSFSGHYRKRAMGIPLRHDMESQLERITAPTLISFGRHDALTSTRFGAPMVQKIRRSELLVFEGCAHAALYENVQEFNEKRLQFLVRHAAAGTA